MMQVLRNNTKVIIWIIVVAFVGTIIFAWGMDLSQGGSGATGSVVGVVNGTELPIRQFGYEVENIIERQRGEQPDKEFTDSDYRSARREAWNSFIVNAIQSEQLAERGIKLTDNELFEFLRRYPPQDVYGIPEFQTEGRFDYQKYIQAMADPNAARFWLALEIRMRPQYTSFKLQEYIGNLVRVSNIDVQNSYIRDNERIKVKYGLAPLKNFSTTEINVDSQSILDYYEQHPDDFFQEEQASYTVLRLAKEPSARDEDRALEEAVEIKRELDAGGDFTELANQYTQDPSGKGTGGDLGWFGPGRMVAAFDSAAFAMEIGEISPPIKTAFGYHILNKKDERKTDSGDDEVNVSHILIRPQLSQETLDDLEGRFDRFLDSVNRDLYDSLVSEYDLVVEQQRRVGRDGLIPGMGTDREVVDWLFASAEWSFSRMHDTQNDFRVYRADGVAPEGTAPLSEVYPVIKRTITEEKQAQMSLETVQRAYDKVVAGTDFTAACQAENVEVKESAFFSRNGRIPGMGQDPIFIGTAFTLSEAKRYSPPVLTESGAAIMQYVDRIPARLDDFEMQKDTLRVQAEQTLRSAYWDKWFQGLIDKAEIEDYRKDLFGEKM